VPEAPEGYVARLPAEEEWERAARGKKGQEYPWGSDFDFTRLSCAEAWEGKEIEDWGKWQVPEFAGTTAVCTYPQGARPDSTWDAAGNVWEWTASRWEPGSVFRVVRGGSWIDDQGYARCASRAGNFPGYYDYYLGLRVVVSLASSEF
jgi:formylglycine-generating enzyme required for sulfatase activity